MSRNKKGVSQATGSLLIAASLVVAGGLQLGELGSSPTDTESTLQRFFSGDVVPDRQLNTSVI